MVFALALELPFDLFVGTTNYVALGINLIFPPSLMFLLNIGIRIPGEENTKRILEKVDEYLYEEKTPRIIEVGKRQKAKSVFERIFLGIYSILFVGVCIYHLGPESITFQPCQPGYFPFLPLCCFILCIPCQKHFPGLCLSRGENRFFCFTSGLPFPSGGQSRAVAFGADFPA